MSKEIGCYGCGQTLQDTDEKMPGYVPTKVLNNKESILCQRCFRLQHYNTNSEFENLMDEDYKKILENITKLDALLVYVIDIFNFEASVIKDLHKYTAGKDLMVLVNKKDILPTSIKDNKIITWVQERLTDLKITNVSDIIITSGQTNYNIDLIIDKINKYRSKKDVYIIGNSNVGKSTFINSLLRNYSNETSHFITTSYFPGTTLNVIKIPLDNKSFVYDTPGIIMNDLMWSIVEPKLLRYILPQKEIKPVNFQLRSGQSLLLGGLAIFDFVEGDNTDFTCYFSNYVDIKRSKLEKSSNTFDNLIKNNNTRPYTRSINTVNDLVGVEVDLNLNDKIDVVISGYGWISFNKSNQKINLRLPKGVSYRVRKALI